MQGNPNEKILVGDEDLPPTQPTAHPFTTDEIREHEALHAPFDYGEDL
jgi:hypothetical protein